MGPLVMAMHTVPGLMWLVDVGRIWWPWLLSPPSGVISHLQLVDIGMIVRCVSVGRTIPGRVRFAMWSIISKFLNALWTSAWFAVQTFLESWSFSRILQCLHDDSLIQSLVAQPKSQKPDCSNFDADTGPFLPLLQMIQMLQVTNFFPRFPLLHIHPRFFRGLFVVRGFALTGRHQKALTDEAAIQLETSVTNCQTAINQNKDRCQA